MCYESAMSPEGGHAERFEFGKNWLDYTETALDTEAYRAATDHIAGVLEHARSRESFLDVGCGSGLFLRAAAESGFERALGFDYDPNSVEASRRMLAHADLSDRVDVDRGDVLDQEYLGHLSSSPAPC